MGKYKNILLPTLVLMVISVLIAALLAFTYNATGVGNLGTGLNDEELVEFAYVIPNAEKLEQVDYTSEEKDLLGVYTDADKTGVALHIQTAGYGGKSKPIEAVVGLDADGVITGVAIASCQETPGLGTKIENPDYLAGYIGVSGSAQGVDTITSATISSKALRNGVDFALAQFEQVKEEVLG